MYIIYFPLYRAFQRVSNNTNLALPPWLGNSWFRIRGKQKGCVVGKGKPVGVGGGGHVGLVEVVLLSKLDPDVAVGRDLLGARVYVAVSSCSWTEGAG